MKIYTFNDKVLTRNTKWLKEYEQPTPPTPPTPSLPPYTIRLKFTEGVTPEFSNGTLTQVSSSPNIWDLTYENSDWSYLCESQEYLVEVISANTTGVTDTSGMFRYCTALTSISLFDTSSVTNMERMFASCALTSIPLLDTSSVTNMTSMFEDSSSLTTVPLINTSNVTNMSSMFGGCAALTTVPLFNTSKVTNMLNMLSNCSSLTTISLFDTSNVTEMRYMCLNCTSLTVIPLFDTSKVDNIESMFQGCVNVQSGALALYQQASARTDPPLYNYLDAFKNCGSNTVTGAAELAQIPTSWGGTAS